MAGMRRRRGSDCGVLLDFEEVRRRLHLGPRRDIGTQEIPVAQVIGSAGRAHEFDGCFRPRTDRLRRVLTEIKHAKPNAADSAILVYQVDHAYFVVDGHKRLSLAVEEGRESIDAEVGRFSSRFHVSSGTTMDDIRATERELQFRQASGLAAAVPEARFPLSEPEGYLDLEESVKAHCYDLSNSEGRLVEPAEGAKHWYDRVYGPAVGIALDSGVARLLSSTTEADRFLLIRQGAHGPMDHDWQIRPAFVEKTRDRLRAAEPGPLPATIARVTRRRRPKPRVLPAGDVDPPHQDPLLARQETDAPAEDNQPSTTAETDGRAD
jgi:hypothetical protein